MDIQRYGHTLIYWNNEIFAIAGSDNLTNLNWVEVYHPNKNYWEEIEPLNKTRETTWGWAIEKRIYIFTINSLDNTGKTTDTIEYLDTKMIYNKWIEIPLKMNNLNLPKNISWFYSDKDNQIILFDPKTRKLWELQMDSSYFAFRMNIKSEYANLSVTKNVVK